MKVAALIFVLAVIAAGIIHMIDKLRYEWSVNGVIPLRDVFFIIAILSIGVMACINIFKHVP